MESTQPPYKPNESDLAEREEVKAQLLDVLRQAEELQKRLDELNAMPDKPQPEKPEQTDHGR